MHLTLTLEVPDHPHPSLSSYHAPNLLDPDQNQSFMLATLDKASETAPPGSGCFSPIAGLRQGERRGCRSDPLQPHLPSVFESQTGVWPGTGLKINRWMDEFQLSWSDHSQPFCPSSLPLELILGDSLRQSHVQTDAKILHAAHSSKNGAENPSHATLAAVFFYPTP